MNLFRGARWWRVAVVAGAALLLSTGCSSDDGDYDSPLINEEVPVVDIADLPDIEQTRKQMQGLIDQVQAEVIRLVPATQPWTRNLEDTTTGCTQESSGNKGVTLYFAKFVSKYSFTDPEWELVYPAVRQLAADAGLTGGAQMQDSSSNHDVRFTSADGRTLVFGSRDATLITGSIACRRAAP